MAAETTLKAFSVNVRIKISALWTSMLFVFAYVDLFSLYRRDVRAGDSLTLLDDRLVAGEHVLTIPDHIPTSAAFATDQIANVIHAFSIATER
jgi:hypothetical protein